MLEPVKNFAKVTVDTGYDDADTAIDLVSGDGAKLPDPAIDGEYRLVWWNSTDYPDPSDDPDVEIVKVTAIDTDQLTIVRGYDGTVASNKNISSKTYLMVLALTANEAQKWVAVDGQDKKTIAIASNDGSVQLSTKGRGRLTVDPAGNMTIAPDLNLITKYSETGSVNLTDVTSKGSVLCFSNDGIYCYVAESGVGSDLIHQFSLTRPFYITTATFVQSWDTDTVGYVRGLAISEDGTKGLLIENLTSRIYEFTMSTAWDISTGTIGSYISIPAGSGSRGMTVSHDGRYIYIVANGTNTVYQYELLTAWNVTAGIRAMGTFAVTGAGNCLTCTINATGTVIYVGSSSLANAVFQLQLSTPYDISTASIVGSNNLFSDNGIISAANVDGFVYVIVSTAIRQFEPILATRVHINDNQISLYNNPANAGGGQLRLLERDTGSSGNVQASLGWNDNGTIRELAFEAGQYIRMNNLAGIYRSGTFTIGSSSNNNVSILQSNIIRNYWDSSNQYLFATNLAPYYRAYRVGTAVTSGNLIGGYTYGGTYDGTNQALTGYIDAYAYENWSGSALGTNLRVALTPAGSTSPVVHAYWIGNGNLNLGPAVSTSNLSRLNVIDGSRTAYTALQAPENYYQSLIRNTNTNGAGVGLAFLVTTDTTQNVGAAIVHRRTSSNSQGVLEFYTKNSSATNVAPNLAAIIDQNQNLYLGSLANKTAGGRLHIVGTTETQTSLITERYSNNNNPAYLKFRKSRGTEESPAGAVQSGDVLGTILYAGHDGSTMSPNARIDNIANANFSSESDLGSYFSIKSALPGATAINERMQIGNGFTTQRLYVSDGVGVIEDTLQKGIDTTDDTPAVTTTYPIDTNQLIMLEFKTTARNTADGNFCAYKKAAQFKNVGGTVTQVGSTVVEIEEAEEVGATCDFNVNGTSVEVVVTGVPGKTLTWRTTLVANN